MEGLTIVESGGDGIGVTGKNITIRKCVCDRNHRQGISVFSVENLLIEDCVLSNTSGTAPQSGIDFEPDHPNEILKNVVMRKGPGSKYKTTGSYRVGTKVTVIGSTGRWYKVKVKGKTGYIMKQYVGK